jgi:hypothetical protein
VNSANDELRLMIAIAINAFLIWSAYRFVAKQTQQSGWRAAMDTLLLNYLIQYVLVCALGLLGILSFASLYTTAAIVAIAMFYFAGSIPSGKSNQIFVGGCALLLIGYFAGLISVVGTSPVIGDDALMYHLPMPAIWLHAHRLTFFTTWFSNPANSYSPLGPETFIAWLMAPTNNDMFAHFVQMPAMLLMFFACVELLAAAGASAGVAALVCVGALLSRPFISQSILVKDDLFVAAFFLVMLAGCASDRLKDRLGPWRIGIATGLFLATKYTALQTAPVLILVIDAPFRAGWRWRQWLIAIVTAIAIAGPWYLRNVILTGNPLYPVPLNIAGVQIFRGLFFPSPSEHMRSLAGVWQTMVGGYQGIAEWLLIIAIIGWVISLLVTWRRLKEPMVRAMVLGPLLVFFFVSHAPEIRYAYPSLMLLLIAMALAISKLPRVVAIPIVAIFATMCALQGFNDTTLVLRYLAIGLTLTAFGWAIAKLPMRGRQLAGVAMCLAAAAWIFVYWQSITDTTSENATLLLSQAYPDLYPLWSAAMAASATDGSIAYSNLALVRPMMGFDYSHEIFYVPTRRGVHWCHDLPSSNEHLAEPQFRAFMEKLLTSDPDEKTWRENLFASGATCLVIGKQPYMRDPPEVRFAASDPKHFRRVFENAAGVVYRVRP